MSDLDLILKYAEHGFPVFPLGPSSKVPMVSGQDGGKGYKDATTDSDQIRTWFEQYPDCNWGLATGTFVVVDIDSRHGGHRVMKRLLDTYNDGQRLDRTPVQRTGGVASEGQHGLHYCFARPKEPLSNRTIAPGIDIRTDGGYIVVAPSKTDAQYEWIVDPFDNDFAQMPSWLIDMAKISKHSQTFDLVDGEVPEGSRNSYLLSMGGRMQRGFFSKEAIRAALLIERNLRCPGIDDGEVDRILENVSKYAPEDPTLLRFMAAEEIELTVQTDAEEAERVALGYIIGSYDKTRVIIADLLLRLEAEAFYVQEHRLIFRAIQRLWISGVTPSFDLIVEELKRHGDYGRFALDTQFVKRLVINGEKIVTDSDAKFFAIRINQAYMLRETSRILAESTAIARKGAEEPDILIGDIASRLMTLLQRGAEDMMADTDESVRRFKVFIDAAKRGQLDLNEPTGWVSIDDKIIGLPKAELTIIAARPSQMKTAFVLQMIRQMTKRWFAQGDDKAALFFSAEMTVEQLMIRTISRETRIDSKRIRLWAKARLPITKSEEQRINSAINDYQQETNIFIDETPSPTPQYMLSKSLAVHAQHNLGLVVFDFLELVGTDKGHGKHDNTVERLSRALVSIKEIAKRTKAPVVIISQLSREVEKRASLSIEPKPRLSDLRYTGQAEQLANQVLMLYYPWFFWKGGIPYEQEPNKEDYFVQIVKNRDGKIGEVPMRVIREYGSIEDRELDVHIIDFQPFITGNEIAAEDATAS